MTPVARLTRLAPIGLGLAFGIYFVFTSPYRPARLWPVWAPFVVAFTTTAGAVYVYGLNRWARVSEEHKVRPSDVAGRIAAIIAVPLLVLIGSTQLPGSVRSSWRQVLLISVLILGGVPAAGAMEGIRHAANSKLVSGTRGKQVVVLVGLRQLLQRLLAAVGSLVALSTLAIGASSTLEQSLAAGSARAQPPRYRHNSCWSSAGPVRCWSRCSTCPRLGPWSVVDSPCPPSCSHSTRPMRRRPS